MYSVVFWNFVGLGRCLSKESMGCPYLHTSQHCRTSRHTAVLAQGYWVFQCGRHPGFSLRNAAAGCWSEQGSFPSCFVPSGTSYQPNSTLSLHRTNLADSSPTKTQPVNSSLRAAEFCWQPALSENPALTLSLLTVINVKIPLQPHKKYDITQYGELDFS